MKGRNWILSVLLLAAIMFTLAGPVNNPRVQAQETLSRVRFLHAVPGAPSVDIYANGMLVAAGLAFGDVTPHLTVPSGEYQVALRQAGTGADSAALIEVNVPLTPNYAFTVVAQGSPGAVEAALYEDILDEIQLGMARLTAISTLADAPTLDVVNSVSGGPLLQGINYGQQYGTVNIPASVQDLVIVPAGGAVESAVAEIGQVPMHAGTLYTIVALGTLEGGVTTKILASSVNGGADTVPVQIAHGSPDTAAADVYVGETLIAASLELGEMTGHVPVPAGTHTIALRPAGAAPADAPYASAEITLDAGSSPQTVVALGLLVDGSLALQQFAGPAETPEDMASISIVNTVPGAVTTAGLNDASTTTLASELAANAQSDAIQVAPGEYMLMVSIQGVDNPVDLVVPAETYYGGMAYTVLVYGGVNAPYNASVSGAAINVGLKSMPAPAQPEAVAAAPEPEPTTAPTASSTELLPLATQAPVVVPPTEAPVQVLPTEAPAQPSTELVGQPTESSGQSELVMQPTQAPTQPPQPVGPQANPNPIAYVEIDPGANLHCRQLPSSEAKSLALIPSGTTLTVIGRTGTPLVPETGNPTPEPTPVVEAVEDLWLAVRWEPQGGGYVNCWVNAQFLRVEFRGKLLDELEELWELPEQPFNLPGEVVGADVSPPTPLFDAILATVELEPGVSLQLRRYPETGAESLGLVPAQAQLEVLGYAEAPSEGLVGQPTDPVWLYVRYRTENGGATIGWVSLQYVSISRLGRPVELTDLVVVDIGEAGYYELPGQAPPIPLEQQDIIGVVNLNPGANLNLRDRPSADALVVVGIPSGDMMVINGRNGDGTWVQVTYESAAGDLDGWVATQYLAITRGGQPWEVAEIPLVPGEVDVMGS